jgi:hypothetical protein
MRTITDIANPGAFASRHLAVAPLPFNRILCTFTGIIVIHLRGASPGYWTYDVLRVGLNPWPALEEARAQGWLEEHTPLPFGYVYLVSFRNEDVAPLVTVSAVYNQNWADNDGKAVDRVTIPAPLPSPSGPLITFDSTLAVRDADAYLLRVGYLVVVTAKVEAIESPT